MQAYWREDPADVSLNAVCELAGVSKPALYRHFGSEDGLMRAVLERYADQVLSEIFEILQRPTSLEATLDALIYFASEDVKMETGCVFYKMRAGKHRLGPMTRACVEEIDAGAVAAFAAFLEERSAAGDWARGLPVAQAARYLVEQMGLALTQRASGTDSVQVRATMEMAMSVLRGG